MLQPQASNGMNQSEKLKKFSFSGTLNSLGRIDRLPEFRFRWNSNEEVFTVLTSLEEHKNWAASEVKMRPPNGSQLLYNRNNLKTRSYHNDKYFWKTRKNSKSSARVDHSSLRIRGIECIYCSYVHSALVPTFHRRCYWLLENPDIVFVHYLNIPDKTTTFDDLLKSLLPFKKLTELELRCQLQPIFTRGQDAENNNTTLSVDVDKLVKELKNYKEPKTKGKSNQKKTSGGNRQVASSTSRKPQEISTKSTHVLDKCCNCNRYYTTNCSLASSSSRTNVAVTINRQAGTSSRSKPPASDGTCHTQVNFNSESAGPNISGQALMSTGSVVKNAIGQNITSATIPQAASNQGFLSADLTGQNTSDQVYPCHDFLASHATNKTASNSCYSYANLPVTSQANICVLDNHLVVLDYDGMNLFQSNQLENDLSNDISFKELVQYLEQPVQYPSDDLHNDKPAKFVEDTPELVTNVSSSMNLDEAAVCKTVMSDGIGLPSYPQYEDLVQQSNAISSTIGTTFGHASCSPADLMSTDCHTFNNFTPSVMHSDASNVLGAIDNPTLSSPNCLSKDQKQTSEKGTLMNTFQMGSLSDVPTSQVSMFQEGGNQVSVSQFSMPSVNVADVATSNVVVAKLVRPIDTQAGSYHQDGSIVGMPQPNGSIEDVSGVEIIPRSLLKVGESTKGTPQTSSLSNQSNPDLRTTENHPGDIITEFSPEWSYCDGKTKVLILGDWSRHNGSYSCLFDGCSVPATLIPPGVLRCFCPPHEPGLVALQVAWNGFIVSNACVFEYKTRDNATNCVSDWLDTSDSDLKKLILERIEKLEGILGISMSSGDTGGEVGVFEDELGAVEDRIVRICEVLLGQPGTCMLPDTETGTKGLTLLHLAAGLGYTKLIRLLQGHAHADMAQTAAIAKQSAEWSPHAKDSFGCTPLMWACWRGHKDAAMTLLAWQPSLYSDSDHSGRTAKAIAQEMGHMDLVHEMEEFIRGKDMYSLVMENSPQSPSSSCAYLSVSSSEHAPQSPMSADSLIWERVEGVSEPAGDFEMANVISEERRNTLGKVLVEVRTLIQEAEERAMSPLHTPSNSAPFSLGFTGFSDLNSDEGTADNLIKSDPDLGSRTPHYDTLSIDSSPIRTPSSHSPGSPTVRNSPQSTGTDTSEFEEFLSKPRQFLERDFSELTLTDIEQQELLQAAKVIQNAYRQFKNRKKQHIDELKAAILIQSYYRRYKQFALYKRITKAAVVIQNSYRAHKEHEQFKRSRHAAAVIQTYFRHYRKRKQRHAEEDAPGKRLEKKYRKPSYGK